VLSYAVPPAFICSRSVPSFYQVSLSEIEVGRSQSIVIAVINATFGGDSWSFSVILACPNPSDDSLIQVPAN
jgi:hypothetical protein